MTLKPPSAVVTVVGWSGVAFFSTGGMFVVGVVVCGATVTCTSNGAVLPARSRSVPERTWMPTGSAPVLKVAWSPARIGATGRPSRCGSSTPASSSLAWIQSESTDVTIAPSAGVAATTDGALLSTRMLPTTLADVFPNESLTIAWKS